MLKRSQVETWLKLPVWRVLGTRLSTVIRAFITITSPRPQPSINYKILEARGRRACVASDISDAGRGTMPFSVL